MEGGVGDVLVDAQLERVYVQSGSGGVLGVVDQQDVLPSTALAVLIPVLDLTPTTAVALSATDDAQQRSHGRAAAARTKIHPLFLE